jgi:hypothetical protein
MISDGTVFASVVELGQYGSRSVVRGVDVEVIGTRGVRLCEVRVIKENINKGV